jgi:type VI secretion system protein ImpK
MTHPAAIDPAAGAPTATAAGRAGRLALIVQELLTATVRLRANRQGPTDAESFRAHIKQLIAAADQEARQAGYAQGDVRYALYAVVAFLDESVLNSAQPMFRDWPRRPLQDELFGGHVAGEAFFQYLQQLMTRDPSADLADVLEVYLLCLLLGFQGRYSATNRDELGLWTSRVRELVSRLRGGTPPLAPDWAIPTGEVVPRTSDPWLRRLLVAAAATLVVALVLYVVYLIVLRSGGPVT